MCMSVSMVWGMQGPRDHLIILPWLWALGVCLKELGGKKHREDNWRVPCGRQEGSCWGEAQGYLQINSFHPSPSPPPSACLQE